jgi:hypothetical protein
VTSVLDRALVALDPFLVTWPLNVALDEAEADDCPKCILSPATDTLDDALTEDWALRVTNPLRVTLDAIPIDADDSLTLVDQQRQPIGRLLRLSLLLGRLLSMQPYRICRRRKALV